MTAKTLTAPDSFYGRVRGKTVAYRIAKDGSEYEVLCGRCGGEGGIDYYGHVDNGICFGCDGAGVLDTISVERANELFTAQDKRAAAKERKRLAVCAERDARVARLEASAPEVHAVLKAAYEYDGTGRRNSFYEQLASQVFNADGKDLSENQVAAVKRGLAKKAEEAAAASPVVEGRGQVTGEIVGIKSVEGDYGVAYKVTIVEDRGFKVYGTLAASLVDHFFDAVQGSDVHWFDVAKGSRVSFVATVAASNDDKAFGFFSRPTKAVVI